MSGANGKGPVTANLSAELIKTLKIERVMNVLSKVACKKRASTKPRVRGRGHGNYTKSGW